MRRAPMAGRTGGYKPDMKLMPYGLGVLVPTLFALLLATPVHAVAHPAPAHPAPAHHTAPQISRFLTAFYGQHGPSGHKRGRHVSAQLQEKQVRTPEYDVLLCAQNEPQRIDIGPVTVQEYAGIGSATVTTHWGSDDTRTFTAYVRLDSKPIELDDVICAP
ncbi:hypothetical protein ACFWBF_21505 [Streptomyces sp. NPDC060028]|uniref:hypothetical protein n=1 Tax=Streptomyces sp. NPDC060028 TaxID=3347041 RepID=UPI0036C9AFFC